MRLFKSVTHAATAAGIIAALGAGASSAEASTVTIDFTTGSSITNQAVGNALSFSGGGVTVTATGWAFDTSLNPDAFARGSVDKYSGYGLGVCNAAEGTSCSSPQHQVDNSGKTDFVLFTFSALVDPTSLLISTFSNADLDVSYWVGTTTAAALNGAQLGSSPNYALSNMGNLVNSDYGGNNDSRTVSLTSPFVTSLLIGARWGSGADNNGDYFKLQQLTFTTSDGGGQNTSPVPEPATLGLFGVGLLAIGSRRWWQKRQ